MNRFKAEATKYEDYVIALRREFHRHPEISGQEVWTSQRICTELDTLEIPYTVLDNRDVVGLLDTGKPGRSIAIRADFDALPVDEEADVDFKSEIPGVMHACGHDSHAAMLLGTARILKEAIAEFSGKIYLCFQIGEEVGIGAAEIVQYLKEQGGVDRAFGLHIGSVVPMGVIGLPVGPLMAGAVTWKLEIRGKGGHGSMPYASIDPIKPACEIVLRYTSLMVNRTDTLKPIVVSPCSFHSGTAVNIIPETTVVEGTIRFFDKATMEQTVQLMRDIADNIAASYGAKATFTTKGGMSIPVINDKESTEIARSIAQNIDGVTVVEGPVMMGSDNFGEFVEAFPGFYSWLGAGNDAIGANVPHHHPKFKIDESSFKIGVEFLSSVAAEYLGK